MTSEAPSRFLPQFWNRIFGSLLGEDADPLPDGHPLLEVLLFDLVDADRLDRALDQVVAFLHRLFIAAGRAGNLAGDVELDLGRGFQRILQ